MRVSTEELTKIFLDQVQKLLQENKSLSAQLKVSQEGISNANTNLIDAVRNGKYYLDKKVETLEVFSFDLKPLDKKMQDYTEQMEQIGSRYGDRLNNPLFSFKMILIYTISLLVLAGYSYFTNAQHLKETANFIRINDERNEYKEFITSRQDRTDNFNAWTDKRHPKK